VEGIVIKPYRISLEGKGPCTDEAMKENLRYALASGYPEVEPVAPNGKSLAVVGGGPSIIQHLDRLADWPGDIWAINQTASWLASKGIKSTFFTVDPSEVIANECGDLTCIDSALVASTVSPRLLDKLRGKDIRIFHLAEQYEEAKLKISGGPSTACRAPKLSIVMGYANVTFFGCEGSFETVSHAYRNENTLENRPWQLIVRAGGVLYRTGPDYMFSSEYLARVIAEFQGYFREESGGLLRAILQHPETWEVVALSEAMKNELDPEAKPYVFPEEEKAEAGRHQFERAQAASR
jgi:hypothetical protein